MMITNALPQLPLWIAIIEDVVWSIPEVSSELVIVLSFAVHFDGTPRSCCQSCDCMLC